MVIIEALPEDLPEDESYKMCGVATPSRNAALLTVPCSCAPWQIFRPPRAAICDAVDRAVRWQRSVCRPPEAHYHRLGKHGDGGAVGGGVPERGRAAAQHTSLRPLGARQGEGCFIGAKPWCCWAGAVHAAHVCIPVSRRQGADLLLTSRSKSQPNIQKSSDQETSLSRWFGSC